MFIMFIFVLKKKKDLVTNNLKQTDAAFNFAELISNN